jgi:asparagine synthase (glutamine-hydrolysing)
MALRDRLPRVGPLRRAASFLDYATGGLGGVALARDGLQMYRRAGLLGERLQDAALDQHAIPWSTESARHLLAEFLQYDRDTRFTGEYLPKVDGATMHHSVEARSPFLDSRLWEFAAALPFEVRLHGGQLKAILREIARRRIGERVAEGRKRGFGIPVQRWLAGKWRDRVAANFRDSLLASEGWLRSDGLLAELHKATRAGFAPNQLWYSYVLESWLRHERHAATESSTTSQSAPAELILT